MIGEIWALRVLEITSEIGCDDSTWQPTCIISEDFCVERGLTVLLILLILKF